MDMNLHVIHNADTHRDLDDTAVDSLATVDSRATRPAPARRQPAGATAWYHDAAVEAARRDAVEALANPYSAVNLPRH